ncbi:hypothetical protein ES319_D04G156600v1 [Gossypium barbadense]|uniref:Uncharacterized protein n=2 Tax=Gossypium TaxID=3633 RepID=A0A5J5S3K4_GOSBA|nr:hypothetical protein ES319_D04G156600v1 [Gossypium barbadense]TYG74235.1 hypothetical protein ES288_D04G166500v1 [Gossypium darwinii]
MKSHNMLFLLRFQYPCPSPSPFAFGCTRPKPYRSPQLSFSTPRRPRRSRSSRSPWNHSHNSHSLSLKRTIDFESSADNPNLKLLLHFDPISPLSSFDRFVSFSSDAFQDLLHSVHIDTQTRTFRFSCRKSTLQFLAGFLVCGLLVAFAFRVCFRLGLAFKARFSPKQKVIVRRDRSLGGKEVIVGTTRDHHHPRTNSSALDNPLSLSATPPNLANKTHYPRLHVRHELPKWWPQQLPQRNTASIFDSEYYQTKANRLIKAIIDNRLGGKDFSEEDIIQLRQICRASGVRVSIDTTNTRDSLYRAAVELVLNVCCRASINSTNVQIDGEDAREFLAGLAENIGLDNIRASRMVSAGVAARTRFCFLQAWAFEMQSKHTEAVSELSKICLIHGIFPPGKSSPEMEMVARGLEKILKVEQRELLMATVVGYCNCSEEIRTSAAEALGLVC